MKKENWQDSEKKYEILVDDMSPLTRADLKRSGLTFADEDDERQETQEKADVSQTTDSAGIRRMLIAAVVLCASAVLGVVVGLGVGGMFKNKTADKAVVSDSSQTSSQEEDTPEEELQQETLSEARFDIDKTASVKGVDFTVLDGMCDDEMLFLTVQIGCKASLIGKSSGKTADPYMYVQCLPDKTNVEMDSFQMLEREGASFTVRAGFRLPQALQKDQEIHVDFYGVSVSREKINPKTGVADVVCNIRQRQPSTVSFVYDGQKGNFARHFYTDAAVSLNDLSQNMDVAYLSPWFCQFSLYAQTDAAQTKEMPVVKVFMKDGRECTAENPASVRIAAGAHWNKDGAPMSRTTYVASFAEPIDSVNVAYIEINGVKADRTDKPLDAQLPSLEIYGYDEAFGN